MGWWKFRLRSGLQSSFAQDVLLSTVNKVLAEICKDVRISTTSSICGSGSTSPSTAIPSGISVHSRHWSLPILSLMRKLRTFITDTDPASH